MGNTWTPVRLRGTASVRTCSVLSGVSAPPTGEPAAFCSHAKAWDWCFFTRRCAKVLHRTFRFRLLNVWFLHTLRQNDSTTAVSQPAPSSPPRALTSDDSHTQRLQVTPTRGKRFVKLFSAVWSNRGQSWIRDTRQSKDRGPPTEKRQQQNQNQPQCWK